MAQDCNQNGIPDSQDVNTTDPDGDGFVSNDCNSNDIPDECELPFELSELIAADSQVGDTFGFSVSMDGNFAVAGAPLSDDAGNKSGSAYVFEQIGDTWTQVAKLTAHDAAPEDEFGYSVAISGSVIVVGAPFDDDVGTSTGAAYVFEIIAGSWQQTQKLVSSDIAAGDEFGTSVSVSGDLLTVGAPLNDALLVDSGAAYIFRKTSNTWTEEARLVEVDSFINEIFAESVSISGDLVAVSSRSDNVFTGAVYLFQYDAGTWQLISKLRASDRSAFDSFSRSVSLRGDRLIVGADQNDDAGNASGSAYIFEMIDGNWVQTAKLTAPDANTSAWFGYRVAIDGDFAISGAINAYYAGWMRGAAYVYRKVNGYWVHWAKLTPDDTTIVHEFSSGVAVSAYTVLVGARFDDDGGDAAGSVYPFDLSRPCSDCNINNVLDTCDSIGNDCDGDGIPDDCTLRRNDCNQSGIHDSCELDGNDCDGNGVPDECDLASFGDCNNNGIVDVCDIATCPPGAFDCADCNGNLIPDGCEPDCDNDGILDECVIAACLNDEFSCVDCDSNGVPDICGAENLDCNANGIADSCEVPRIVGKIVRSSEETDGRFGQSIEVDGDTAIVGTRGNDAVVLQVVNGSWQEIGVLTVPEDIDESWFGADVGISGNYAIVGAPFYSTSGGAFVFKRIDGNWQYQQSLEASTFGSNDEFGNSVAIDGDCILVGARRFDGVASQSGAVFVFERMNDVWQEKTILTASDAAFSGFFGHHIRMSGDKAVITAPFARDETSGVQGGFAYIFNRVEGNWTEVEKIAATNPIENARFGWSADIDGNTIVVGAPEDNTEVGNSAGSTYVFEEIGGEWQLAAELHPADACSYCYFGGVTAIKSDRIIAGNYSFIEGSLEARTYLFGRLVGGWRQIGQIAPPDAFVFIERRFDVRLTATSALIAVPFDGANEGGRGSVFVATTEVMESDCLGDGGLDSCRADCNANGIPDDCEITSGTSDDCSGNGLPDACDGLLNSSSMAAAIIAASDESIDICLFDGDGNGVLDGRDIGPWLLRNADTSSCTPSSTDIAEFVTALISGSSDSDTVCEFDGDSNSVIDGRDIMPFIDRIIE